MYIPEILYYVFYNVFYILIHFCKPYHTLGSGILSENWCVCVTMVFQLVLKSEPRATNGAPIAW